MSARQPVEASNVGASGVPTRTTGRDLDASRAALQEWFARTLGAPALRLTDLRLPPSTGVANETILCDASWEDAGGPQTASFVVRVHSPDFLYKGADLGLHARMYESLAEDPNVPVPRVVGYEPDTSILGQAFFVMEKVEGRVPEDNPPYHSAGWVAELAPAERRRLWENAVRAMHALHQTDVAKLAFLDRPHLGRTGLEQEVEAYLDYHQWAARGRSFPVVEAAATWLRDNLPQDEPSALSWGDARVGNIMFDGQEVVALLDWDMVSLAGPEADLAWWSIIELMYTVSAGTPALEGIGTADDTITLWEELEGRPVRNLWYHLVFAAFRMATILIRLPDLLEADGVLPPEVANEMRANNTGIQYLATMLDLPHDGEIVTPWPGIGRPC
jgi:aminoglycoside phosphotransferase (APT) family kinase protein